jgi:hypothetical protein
MKLQDIFDSIVQFQVTYREVLIEGSEAYTELSKIIEVFRAWEP